MTTPAIQGVLPVVPLPYHDDYTIDYATLQREGTSHSCSAIRTMRAARDRRRVSSRGKILLVKQGIFRNTFIRGPLGSVPDSKTESAVLAAFDRLRDAA